MEKTIKYTDKLLELCLLSALFMVPLAFWLPFNESFELPKTAAFYFFVSLALCLWLARGLLSGGITLKLSGFFLPAAALAAVSALSFVKGISINPAAAPLHWQFLKLLLAAVLLYFLIVNTFHRPKILKLAAFILLPHFIAVIYGVLQYFGIDFIKWVSFGEGRVYSTLGNPDYMAAQFSILVPLMLALALSGIRNIYRACLLLFMLLMFMLIIVSHGRGAWLGFLASLGYMIIMTWILYGRDFFLRHRAFITGLLIFVAALAALFSFPNPVNRNSVTLADRIKSGLSFTNDSVAVRLFYWESAVHMAYKNPLLGTGIGGFSLNTAYYQRKVYDRWEKAAPKMAQKVEPHVELYTHNDYLQTMAETGLIGLGVFLWILAAALLKPFSVMVREDNHVYRRLLLGITGSVVAFAVNALLNFPWRVMPTLVLMWSLFALFSLLEHKKSLRVSVPALPAAAALLLIPALLFQSAEIRTLTANLCIKKGQAAFAKSGYADARDYFERGLSSNPRGTDIIELVLYAGNAYNALGNLDKAIEHYNRGLKMYPHFIESHYNVANVYFNNKMYDKALEEYNKVLALNPKFSAAYNNMANMYFNDNKLEQAREMYQKALDIKPSSVEARYNLGATYFRMARYADAYRELNEVLKYDPDYSLAKEWIAKMKAAGLAK
ncbi:MAG TPA: tetratricopeptide repeat protein [Candidatus Goldiibacteriota bacterium]|nr:tetratricopeptide repeat protein [Candidatus Goldiibacteriota bacterium]